MWKLWKRPPKVSRVHDMCPLLAIEEDRATTVTKDGDLVRVIALRGQDFTGRDHELLEVARDQRQRFFEEVNEGISLTSHSSRIEVEGTMRGEGYENEVAREIGGRWAATFASSFRTHHYLIVRTARPSLVSKASQRLDKAGQRPPRAILDDAVESVLDRLAEYEPELLSGDGLVSYWASRLNGRHCRQSDPGGWTLDDLLSDVDLYLPDDKPYQVYEGQETRYSAWLAIKAYPGTTTGRMIDDLFRVRAEFNLFQSVQVLPREAGIAHANDLER